MRAPKKKIKSIVNFVVVLVVALFGFFKVKTLMGFLIGVPLISWLAYLLSNAICFDLLFGETAGCSEKSIYKDE